MTKESNPISTEPAAKVQLTNQQQLDATEQTLASEFFEESQRYLSQGDILYTQVLNTEIARLGGGDLSNLVYPYFFDRYKLCTVLNATCDLVTTDGRQRKVDCVQLVALSPLIDTLQPIIKRYAGKGFEFELIDESAYLKLADEFRRIVDGQHKTRYFLPRIPDVPFDSPWTARLDVIVSIRYEHPEAFLAAQTGYKICSQRASKLAENTAALFNRIALDDVRDVLGGSDAYKDWVDKQVIDFCKPIPSAVFTKVIPLLRQACKGLENADRDSKILAILQQHRDESQSPQMQKLLACIEKRASAHLSIDKLSKFMNGIDAEFEKILIQKN